MSIKQFRVKYPISEEVKTALEIYPNIASSIQLTTSGYSELEIVRLLDNQHHAGIKVLTLVIEEILSVAGDIGKKVLDCKDPFQFAQAISELYLLKYLYQTLGPDIRAAISKRGQTRWDITASIDGNEIRFEIYTPIELAGYQLFDRFIKSLLKYMDLTFGYYLNVQVGIQRSGSEYNPSDLYYTYTTGNPEEVNKWLHDFDKKVRSWIKCKSILKRKNQQLTIPGPGNKLKVTINILEWKKDPRERDIMIGWPTKSSDTKLFFESKNPETIAKNEWGRKIRGKMHKKQCGQQAHDYTRILVLNFGLADAGWPEFISESWFTTNFSNFISFLSTDEQLYDAVIPAQLGIDCCFGKIAWISTYHKENYDYAAHLGLNKQCEPPPDAPQEEINEIVKGWKTLDE